MTRDEFEKLYAEVFDAACNVAARKLALPRDDARVLDAVQKAAVYCIERVEAGHAITRSYLLQKAKNCALDSVRAAQRWNKVVEEDTRPVRGRRVSGPRSLGPDDEAFESESDSFGSAGR